MKLEKKKGNEKRLQLFLLELLNHVGYERKGMNHDCGGYK